MRPIRLIFAFYYFYPIKLLCRVLKAVLGHSDASCCVVFFISLSNQLLNFVFIRKINIIRIILYQFLKHLFAVSYPLFLLKRGRTCTKKFCLTEGHDAVQRTRIGIPPIKYLHHSNALPICIRAIYCGYGIVVI